MGIPASAVRIRSPAPKQQRRLVQTAGPRRRSPLTEFMNIVECTSQRHMDMEVELYLRISHLLEDTFSPLQGPYYIEENQN